MKVIFYILVVCSVFGCADAQNQKVIFNFENVPCEMADQSLVAQTLNIPVVDIIFQTVSAEKNPKVCTLYKNVAPKPLPLLHLTADKDYKTPASIDQMFSELIKNGIPGSEVLSVFKAFPDKRFKAVYSESQPNYNQVYLNVDNKGILIMEYDKSLVQNTDNIELARKLMELYLYGRKKS
jgi:hypothetical protein